MENLIYNLNQDFDIKIKENYDLRKQLAFKLHN